MQDIKSKTNKIPVIEKYSANLTDKKIVGLSRKLLHLRTVLILEKRRIQKQEESVQKYFATETFNFYNDFVSDIEKEFLLCKYLYHNMER